MKKFLVALFGILICGSAFACTINRTEVVSVDHEKGIAELRDVPVYIGPGSCNMPGGKDGGFEKRKHTAIDIRNKYAEIQHRKKMGMQTGAQEKELSEMIAE